MKLTKSERHLCIRALGSLHMWFILDVQHADKKQRQHYVEQTSRLVKLREKLKRGLK